MGSGEVQQESRMISSNSKPTTWYRFIFPLAISCDKLFCIHLLSNFIFVMDLCPLLALMTGSLICLILETLRGRRFLARSPDGRLHLTLFLCLYFFFLFFHFAISISYYAFVSHLTSIYVSVQSIVFSIASCTVYIVCKIFLLQCRV